MQRHRIHLTLFALAAALVLASCAPQATPVVVIATKTPKPTFTPTVAVTPTQLVIPTAAPLVATAAPVAATAAPQPTTVAATAVPPTATPQSSPQFSAAQTVNVRRGPGTNYPIVGQLNAGDNYKVSGKNQDSSWLQFNFNGDPAWVSAGLVSFSGDASAVALAQNIPVAPTAPPAPPTVPPAPTAPPPPPAPTYKYGNAVVASCRPQAGGTWFNGTVSLNGQAVDGSSVVFSWQPDGSPIASIVAGPHPGYPGWDHGYYSHIVNDQPGRPRAGDWYVWVVEGGQRVSAIAHWHSDGSVPEGTGCNDATVNFSN